MVRLFVALPIPDEIRARLSAMAGGIRGARWSPPENLHVTLRFIGAVEEGLAREIDAALMEVRAAPFPLTLRDLGLFGTGHRQRTLWAGVVKDKPLSQLKGRIETALRDLGLEPDTRQFTPHVTLARLDGAEPEAPRSFVESHNLAVTGTWEVTDFVLFSSHLHRDGPIYTAEAVYPLEG